MSYTSIAIGAAQSTKRTDLKPSKRRATRLLPVFRDSNQPPKSNLRSLKGVPSMRNRLLLVAVCLLPLLFSPFPSSAGSKQLIVSLSRGGFVAFRSETEWANARKALQFSGTTSSALRSQALVDENQI